MRIRTKNLELIKSDTSDEIVIIDFMDDGAESFVYCCADDFPDDYAMQAVTELMIMLDSQKRG